MAKKLKIEIEVKLTILDDETGEQYQIPAYSEASTISTKVEKKAFLDEINRGINERQILAIMEKWPLMDSRVHAISKEIGWGVTALMPVFTSLADQGFISRSNGRKYHERTLTDKGRNHIK